MAEYGGKKQQQSNQRIFKGCSCKKSQCIKNYCDCYQSMIICTKYCKCIGCRNTEQRESVAVKPETSKKIHDAQLQAGLVQAKVIAQRPPLAAAARNLPAMTSQTQLQQQQLQLQQKQKQQQQQQHQNQQQQTQQQQIAAQHASQQQKPSTQAAPSTPAVEECNLNILMPEVCDSVLASLLAQEEEAEQVGLDAPERAQLLMNEMERCLSIIYKASLPV